MKRLAGEYFNTLDEKGRVAFPAKIRADLTGASLVITKSLDSCLWLFASDDWEKVTGGLAAKSSLFNERSRLVLRALIAPATEVEFDKSGRILVPPSLREYAALERDCVILGLGAYVELWDAATYKNYMAENAKALAAAAEDLGVFSFA